MSAWERERFITFVENLLEYFSTLATHVAFVCLFVFLHLNKLKNRVSLKLYTVIYHELYFFKRNGRLGQIVLCYLEPNILIINVFWSSNNAKLHGSIKYKMTKIMFYLLSWGWRAKSQEEQTRSISNSRDCIHKTAATVIFWSTSGDISGTWLV